MKRRSRLLLTIGGLAIALAVFSGWVPRSPASSRTGGERRALYYVDPMHPNYRSDQPGRAPDCGMDLEPVYTEEHDAAATLQLAAEQEQAIQLQTEAAHTASIVNRVRTAGRVVPVEALTYRVSAGVDGWIRATRNGETGTYVTEGQSLASFYGKDISAPQQAYLYALDSHERLRRTPSASPEQVALAAEQVTTARDNLRFVGLDGSQISELGRLRRESSEIILKAPCNCQVLERNATVGQRFMKGDLLYQLADLSRVWILADVSSVHEVQNVRRAEVQLQGLPATAGKISAVLPQPNPESRIGKLRLEVDNRDRQFVPGMIVDVSLEIPLRPAITVSVDAILDGGASKSVFVADDNRRYELREVDTGWQSDGRVEITRGLAEGERVVTAGTFLLDSESRMRKGSRR